MYKCDRTQLQTRLDTWFKEKNTGKFASPEHVSSLSEEERGNYEPINERIRAKILEEVEALDSISDDLEELIGGKVVVVFEDRKLEDVVEEVKGFLNNDYYYA